MMQTLLRNRPVLMALAAVLILPLVVSSGSLATEVLIYTMAALGCNLLLGYAGLLSFGQGIFFGVGSYTLGILLTLTPLPMPLVLLLVVVAGAVVAGMVGWLAIRQTGIYFVMLTFALAQMFYFIAYSIPEITGGDNGLLDVPRPALTIFGQTLLSNRTPWDYYGFVAVIFVVVFWMMQRVVDSIFGRTLLAMRDNPARTSALGYDTTRLKLVAFMISGAVTALAGSLFPMMTGIAPLTSIEFRMSETILLVTVLGGSGNLMASIVGGAFYVIVSDWLSDLWPRWLLVFGLLLMVISLYMQGGLWGACRLLARVARGGKAGSASREAP